MNYRKITATDNIKKLINTILKTRKKVYQYVWFNIIYAVLSIIIVLIIQFNYDERLIELIKVSEKSNKAMLIYGIYTGITILFLAVFIGLIWIFYRVIYGILLRRLYKNYEELKKIDY
jgi:hypothetical protein